MENEQRKMRVRKPDGEIEYIDPKDFTPSPIINMNLSEEILDRISWVYKNIKDVLSTTMPSIKTEEQFQILFMRDDNPEKDVATWEDIIRTYKIALNKCSDDDMETRSTIFRIIMFHITDSLSEEEKQREDIISIIKIFESLQRMDSVVKRSVDLEDEEEES